MSNVDISVKREGLVDHKKLVIKSSVFKEGDLIPVKYTCDGADINPPMKITGIPEKTKSLAIIVEDPDAPAGTWVHWIVWNIPVVSEIEEKKIGGTVGINDFLNNSYNGPCPPFGTHRYYYQVYALDTKLELRESSRRYQLEKAMVGHILASGTLIGLYHRSL